VKVLVVGGGGREHALCWRLAQDPTVTRVLAAPGNAGIALAAECFSEVPADDAAAIVDLVDRQDVDLTVVGPEAPLVAGLADVLRKRGRNVFGPSAAAARIEGSKAFAKEVMARRGVPTARSGAFDDVQKAIAFVDGLGGRAVVKADGPAAGKGVVVASDRGTAARAIEDCLVRDAFGEAGRTVVVEEILEGPEVSMFALTDGKGSCVLLDSAQDHKRVGDGDTGPNTGGMGCYSPVPFVDQETATWVLDNVLAQVVDELRPYRGVLYAGLMLTADGPKVLEFNCRFGDPETQVLLPRMPYGFGTLLHACATGRLAHEAGHAGFDDGAAVTVVIASGARYRRPAVPGLADFEGRGIWYWASALEAKLCGGEEVAIIGGGNSAGQAAVFLADHASRVHMLIRGKGLAATMSRYLIDRIAASPVIELHPNTELTRLYGDEAARLKAISWRDNAAGTEQKADIRNVFVFVGADPETGWLRGREVALDAHGFVLTGLAAQGPDGRAPTPLEASVPGLFAAGDVRSGSVKRVGGAIGEGAAAVAQIHQYLSQSRRDVALRTT